MGDRPANFKLGRVRASVWANESETGRWYSISFSRLYKDKEGRWQVSTRFSREDLPLVMKAADQAHTFIYEYDRYKEPDDGRYPEPDRGDVPESGIPPEPFDAAPPERKQ